MITRDYACILNDREACSFIFLSVRLKENFIALLYSTAARLLPFPLSLIIDNHEFFFSFFFLFLFFSFFFRKKTKGRAGAYLACPANSVLQNWICPSRSFRSFPLRLLKNKINARNYAQWDYEWDSGV